MVDTVWMSKPFCGSDARQPPSPRRQPELSMPQVNTPQGQTSKTHSAGSINYSEWQINVFHNSTLVVFGVFFLNCSLSWGEDKQQPVLSINMHSGPSNEQTPWNKHGPLDWVTKKYTQRWERELWDAALVCADGSSTDKLNRQCESAEGWRCFGSVFLFYVVLTCGHCWSPSISLICLFTVFDIRYLVVWLVGWLI